MKARKFIGKTKLLLPSFVVSLVLGASFFVVSFFGAQASGHTQSIVIDPGHGGADSGGTGNGMEEKDIVLDTSMRFLALLRASGAQGGRNWSAEITRDTDVFIPLAARSDFANAMGVDRFLSIHANAFSDPQANGTETFSFGEPSTSSEMRDLIQEEMVQEWMLRNRGGKTANFSVLRRTSMPSTLSELGFVTNAGDAALLASLDARQRAAEAHVRALTRHFEGVPDPNPFPDAGPDAGPDSLTGSILVSVLLDSDPVAEALIQLDGQDVGATDADGELLLKNLALGSHRLSATVSDFSPTEITVEVLAAQASPASFNFAHNSTSTLPTGCAGCSSGGAPSPWSPLLWLALALEVGRRRRARYQRSERS